MSTQTLLHPERRRGERRQHSAAGGPNEGSQSHGHEMHAASYRRFWAMVLTSTAVGFGATYLNTYALDHVEFSWTRVFMAMIMGGVMTAVMSASCGRCTRTAAQLRHPRRGRRAGARRHRPRALQARWMTWPTCAP